MIFFYVINRLIIKVIFADGQSFDIDNEKLQKSSVIDSLINIPNTTEINLDKYPFITYETLIAVLENQDFEKVQDFLDINDPDYISNSFKNYKKISIGILKMTCDINSRLNKKNILYKLIENLYKINEYHLFDKMYNELKDFFKKLSEESKYYYNFFNIKN